MSVTFYKKTQSSLVKSNYYNVVVPIEGIPSLQIGGEQYSIICTEPVSPV